MGLMSKIQQPEGRLKRSPGSLYLRGTTWWYKLTAADGRTIQKSAETDNRDQAQLKLYRALATERMAEVEHFLAAEQYLKARLDYEAGKGHDLRDTGKRGDKKRARTAGGDSPRSARGGRG